MVFCQNAQITGETIFEIDVMTYPVELIDYRCMFSIIAFSELQVLPSNGKDLMG